MAQRDYGGEGIVTGLWGKQQAISDSTDVKIDIKPKKTPFFKPKMVTGDDLPFR